MTIITPGPAHYRAVRALAPRATSSEDRMIHRLATKCQILAAQYGEELDWKAAIARARENVAFVRQVAALKGVEW